MYFFYDKVVCQNVRRALRHEWLITNGLGDYASSSIVCCNTRKYHGLFVCATPGGRRVMLSTLEESLVGEEREFIFSTRQHPMTMFPNGYQFQELFTQQDWPVFVYRMGNTFIRRELLLMRNEARLLIRYSFEGNGLLPTALRLKPLLAARSFHTLRKADPSFVPETTPVEGGFALKMSDADPTLFFQVFHHHEWEDSSDWYYDIEYQQENERGFPYREDLFMAGRLNVTIGSDKSICLSVGKTPCTRSPEELWRQETDALLLERQHREPCVAQHLQNVGEQFIVKYPMGSVSVLAGYHWFDAWGRDTLISLPGLTFACGRHEVGKTILAQIARSMRNGLIPNMFGPDGHNAYNSVDASLWYAFAVQCLLASDPLALPWVHTHAWPAIKQIVEGFFKGPGFDVHFDREGMLYAGNAHTQLTWMDAQVNGQPVTPRHGCAVELNALWYNTLELRQELAEKFGEGTDPEMENRLAAMRKAFLQRFYVNTPRGGYLGDVWRDGWLDRSIRPNQIFAVSMPHSILPEKYHMEVWHTVKENLLTPFGLRTLAPGDAQFKSRYEGSPAERDASYHQGTVWPWLLGHYTDALIRATWAVEQEIHDLLETVTPLLSDHLLDAGIGSISEVFDAAPPYRPNGCISQAWSVAECVRMLFRARSVAPGVYANFESKVMQRLHNPSDDTAGVGRVKEMFA
ncbi:MAG: amylo-alpha-1,6-glucosidase [Desulfovibrio sp.]|nr:amylo-alpha-1,6-glucosidase [Desulfovibrio sp.]